jgi:hypothetical protein
MKPCSKNRKPIAWLALDALDVRQAQELRAHLETCEGCRRYLVEISNVTQRLTAAEVKPDIRVSESFHQRVVGRLSAEKSGSAWATVAVQLRRTMLDWRVALPMVGATVVMIAVLSTFLRRPNVLLPAPSSVQLASAPNLTRDPQPTIANYQMVATQSLEDFDELLTRQGNRNLPLVPIYTASTFTRADASD